MTGRLKTITASRSELEREINEHKQAEEALRESEAHYRGVIESQLDLIVRLDLTDCFTFANDAYCQKFGLKREEILGKESYKPLVHPEDLPHTLEAMKALYQPPYRVLVEQRAFAVEGLRWIEWQDSAIRDEMGNVVEIQAIGRDITERKKAEEALRRNESILLQTGKLAKIGGWELDLQTITLHWSAETYRIHEVDPSLQPDLENALNYYAPEARPVISQAVQRAIEESQPYDLELPFITAKGKNLWIHTMGQPEFRDGKCVRIFGTFQDITERKQAEEALRESERRLTRAQEIAHLGSWELDLITNQLTWSDEVYRIFGLQPQEFAATYEAFLEAIHPEDRAAVNEAYSGSIREGRDSYEIEHRVVRRSTGEIRIVYEKCEHFRDKSGQIMRSAGMVHDITVRKRAEQALLESEEKYRLLADHANDWIYWIKPDKSFQYISPSCEQLTGFTPLEFINNPQLLIDIIHPEDRVRVEAHLGEIREGTETHELDYRIVTKASRVRWISHSCEPVYAEDGKYLGRSGTNRDVTERKRAEEQSTLLANRLALATRSAHMGIWDWDIQNNELVWDDQMYTLYGLEPGKFGGAYQAWLNGVHPDDRDLSNQVSQQAVRGERGYDTEFRIVRPDGSIHWLKANGEVFRDGLGRPLRMVGVNYDITERKQAEEALRESEERYRSLFENMVSGYAYCQMLFDETNAPRDFIYMNVNDMFEKLTGLRNVEGKKVSEVIPGIQESNRELFEIYGRVSSTGEPERFETYLESLDIWFSVSVYSPRKDYFVAVFDNITERKRAEAEIASLAKFPTENPNPILRVQADGRLIYANAASQELLEDWNCGINDDLPEELRDFIAIALDDHLNKTVDVFCKEKVYSIMLVPIVESEYVNIYGRDITERKRAEDALKRLAEDLRRSNAELEQFAYVASHDLQEPLRMVSSYMQLLKRRYQARLDNDADEFIGFAVDGAARMQQLINDLLTFSRVGTRGSPMGLSSCEKVLAEALMNLQVSIEESQAIITHDPLPTVFCDQPQLVQVFQNLVGNSIKFRGRQAPEIHISAKRAESEWIFSFCDNGIGLDPRFGERIFEIFQRLHSRTAYPGTGIGLAICKRIVQRHGGRIWVESKPGEGATFYFTIPIKETS
jgi:PAS domain S-box-containing protein